MYRTIHAQFKWLLQACAVVQMAVNGIFVKSLLFLVE